MIAAVDIGGTKIAVGMVDEKGNVAGVLESLTQAQRGFDNGIREIRRMLLESASAAGEPIEGVGIGCTGPVDAFTGRILHADTIPGWEGRDLVGAIAREFAVPVAMENDADAAALGEFAWGTGRGKRNFIYVTLSTGIGVGVILDGCLYRGVDGAHPEIGHQTIDGSGTQCYCGARGCWESLASGPAMVAWVRANCGPGDPYGMDLAAERIFELAQKGDPLAQRAVDRVGHYVGIGLANLVTIFCPDVIALGGGLMKSGNAFVEHARSVIRRACGLVPHEKTAVVDAALGAHVGLAGAARAWHYRFSMDRAKA